MLLRSKKLLTSRLKQMKKYGNLDKKRDSQNPSNQLIQTKETRKKAQTSTIKSRKHTLSTR